MAEALSNRLQNSVRLPVRPKAKQTYERILSAAQEILSERGIEALNSNAIVEKAGVTAPVFYHYFKNKHALLLMLASRFLDAQDEIYERLVTEPHTSKDMVSAICKTVLFEVHDLTVKTVGAGALLTALRAIPEISEVRIEANERAARMTAKQLRRVRPELSRRDAYERSLLGIEIGYGAIEMLLESPRLPSKRMLEHTANAIMAVYFE